ncbi:MAG: hypothetical protein ACI4KD_05965 [Oscillospiraceae bacterium]
MAQNKKTGLKIQALHTAGKTVAEIAKETSLSEEEIVKYLEERCLTPIFAHEQPPVHEWSGKHKVESKRAPMIIIDEVNKIAELYNQGITLKGIADETGIKYDRVTAVVKKARKIGLIGYRQIPKEKVPIHSETEVAPEPDEPSELSEIKEEFCCEVTPETDMDEYMKDREKIIPTKKPLPDIVIESIKGMKDILEAKIEDAEYK